MSATKVHKLAQKRAQPRKLARKCWNEAPVASALRFTRVCACRHAPSQGGGGTAHNEHSIRTPHHGDNCAG